MKIIKIFLASSIEELKFDRIEVGDFFRRLYDIYNNEDIKIQLIKCEDLEQSIINGGKQDYLDKEIRESELCCFLFFRKIGDYTRHEFEVALDAFKRNDKPKIVTYFKYVTSIDEVDDEIRDFMNMLDTELHHYYSTYNHIDTLKLDMLMQIKLLKIGYPEMSISDGELTVNGQTVTSIKNVPIILGNEALRKLTEQKIALGAKLAERRIIYLDDPCEDNERAFFEASAELNAVSKRLTEIENDTLKLITSIAEISGGNKCITHRQKQALQYYNSGDYIRAQRVLTDSERECELERAQKRIDVSKSEIQGYIEENLLWIKAEIARGLTESSSKKIRDKYEKAAALVWKHGLDTDVVYEYACYLYNQKDYAEATEAAEKLKWHYGKPGSEVSDEKRGDLFNLLGMLYYTAQRYGEAEREYLAALDIKEKCCGSSEVYERDVAMIYNNLAALYNSMDDNEKAEQMYLSALGIRIRLAERNPALFEQDLARSFNNLGVFYSRVGKYVESKKAHLKAFEIRKRLAETYPDSFMPALARSYNNIAELCCRMQDFEEAEKAHLIAIEIRKKLVEKNPEANEADLAISYNNLGGLYSKMQKDQSAEKAYLTAIEINKKLAKSNPDVFYPKVATCYYNLAMLYIDIKAYAKANVVLHEELSLLEKLSEKDPKKYQSQIKTAKSFLELISKIG